MRHNSIIERDLSVISSGHMAEVKTLILSEVLQKQDCLKSIVDTIAKLGPSVSILKLPAEPSGGRD